MPGILIKNGTVVNEGKQYPANILVKEGKIASIYKDSTPATDTGIITLDASGKYIIPGVIDDQVHFRQPGLTHKADIASESAAAVAGGITSFMEMPNTIPQATTQEILEEKYKIAARDSLANYSFYIGATNNNLDELLKTNPNEVCGIKIFMGSSTGNMLVDDKNTLEQIFAQSKLLIATHCEDETTIRNNIEKAKQEFGEDIPMKYHPIIRNEEACYKSSSFAVELASKYNSRLHILHISTAKELELFEDRPYTPDKRITNEVCIHHLWFNDQDYDKMGSRIKWNPAVKSEHDRTALFEGLLGNKIDVIATDHAPHTIEEKSNPYLKAPSGGPMVQHALPAMLEFYYRKKISLEQIVRKMCHAPANLFQIDRRGYIREGYWADLVIIDPHQEWKVNSGNLLYKCKWSPFEGQVFHAKVTHTLVNGNMVVENGKFNYNFRGHRLKFNR